MIQISIVINFHADKCTGVNRLNQCMVNPQKSTVKVSSLSWRDKSTSAQLIANKLEVILIHVTYRKRQLDMMWRYDTPAKYFATIVGTLMWVVEWFSVKQSSCSDLGTQLVTSPLNQW